MSTLSTPLSTPQEDPITWTTTYRGQSYVLTDTGQLRPAHAPAAHQHRGFTTRPQSANEGAHTMSHAHLEQMRENRQRDALRAVSEELHALALRRAEHHAKEQPR